MNELQIRSLVDDLVAAWNSRDMGRFLELLDESVVWEDPAMLFGPAKGRAGVRAFSESILRAFPDFAYRIREPICVSQSGTRCAVPWEIQATHTGYFDTLGLAPTMQTITMRGVDLLEIQNMKVTRIETLFNVLPAFQLALRLRPLSKGSLLIKLAVWLQRSRAFWLRLTTSRRQL